MLVIEAAQLMAAKRSDCVLVVDEDEHLSGIFTVSITTSVASRNVQNFLLTRVFPKAKDLAYRVVADSLDPRYMSCSNLSP